MQTTRFYIDARTLHQCQREKGSGALKALAFCVWFRFSHKHQIIYSHSTQKVGERFNIGVGCLNRIIDNAVRLGLARKTNNEDYELLSFKPYNRTLVPIEVDYIIKDAKLTTIENTLSLYDFCNQIRILKEKKHQREHCARSKMSVPSKRDANILEHGINVSYRTIADIMNVSERTAMRYAKEANRKRIVAKVYDCKPVMDFEGFIDINEMREEYDGEGFLYISGTGKHKRVYCQKCNVYIPTSMNNHRIFAVIKSRNRRVKNRVTPKKSSLLSSKDSTTACTCVRMSESERIAYGMAALER